MIDANRRMPALSPSASASACAERDAAVLHGVVAVDLQVARARHVEVEPRVLAELLEHVVEERDAGVGGRRARPVEVRARRRCRSPSSCALTLAVRVTRRAPPRRLVRNRSTSCSAPAVTRSAFGTTARQVAHEHAAVEQTLPDLDRVVGPAARTARSSRRSGRRSARASRRARARCRSRWARIASSSARASPRWRSATIPAAWASADRWYGSRTRCRSATTAGFVEHVAEPRARHRERLRERAHDRHVRVIGHELQRALAAELDVGLVDDHERARALGERRRPPRAAARCRSGCSASRRRRRRGRRLRALGDRSRRSSENGRVELEPGRPRCA